MVFLDMTGLFEDTWRAMRDSVRLLRHYGVLAVHDCGHPEWPGVERAIKQFAWWRNTNYRQVDSTAIFEQTWRHDGSSLQAGRDVHLRVA